jgi:hypothetical protein
VSGVQPVDMPLEFELLVLVVLDGLPVVDATGELPVLMDTDAPFVELDPLGFVELVAPPSGVPFRAKPGRQSPRARASAAWNAPPAPRCAKAARRPDTAAQFRRKLRRGQRGAALRCAGPLRQNSCPVTSHDLRATGLTWAAVRGDDPPKIQQRAGRAGFNTTQVYIRTAERVRAGLGEPFPPLPDDLLESPRIAPGRLKAHDSAKKKGIQAPAAGPEMA